MLKPALSVLALAWILAACSASKGLPEAAQPDWTYTGREASANLGHRAQSAGDVNNDGYDDLIASAPGAASGMGRVFLWHGSAKGLATEPDWQAQGRTKREVFGDRAGQAGDLNNDGYGDVFISAPGFNGGVGRLYVFYGGPQGLRPAPWSYSPESAQEQFGDCTAPTGDLNNDGFDDLAVGAYGHDQARGRVLLFLGSAKGLGAAPVWEGRGEAAGDEYGYSLSTAGDVDGDGYGDLLIGAKYSDAQAIDGGKAYLLLGGRPPLRTLPWTQAGLEQGGHLAYRLYGLGDLDGDGLGECVVSAPREDGRLGRIYILRGADALKGRPAVEAFIGRPLGLGNFGQSVGPAGDFNGDGKQDLLVGAQLGAIGQALLWFSDKGQFKGAPQWRAQGERVGDQFAAWAAPAGDLNGDGSDDLVVSANSFFEKPGESGKIYVYYGFKKRNNLKSAYQGYLVRHTK